MRSLPFSTDEFFAAIRACYNARASDDAYQRLTFCLLGVATPADLIEDVRLTPFNIGKRIHLEDFTPVEAEWLQKGLGNDQKTNQSVMARILYWTGGHPCLTQRLCKAVVENAPAGSVAEVDACCARLFLAPDGERTEDNLVSVGQRLTGNEEHETAELLVLYDKVLTGKPVLDDETRPFVARLKLTGVVKAERNRLVVRNRIYARVFNRVWVQKHLPGAERQRQRTAFHRGVMRTAAVALAMLSVVASLAIIAVRQAKLANHYERQARSENAKTLDLLYASDMQLIALAYERNEFRSMRSLLAETHSNPNRGFEWFYWQGTLHDEVLTLRHSTAPVFTAIFSQDSQRLLTNGEDGLVKLWNIQTGQELLAFRQPGSVMDASHSADGRLIVRKAKSGIQLWDAATGHLLGLLPNVSDPEFYLTTPPTWLCALKASGPPPYFSLYTIDPLQDRQRDRQNKRPPPYFSPYTIYQYPLICYHFEKDTTVYVGPDCGRAVVVTANRIARLWDNKTQRQIGTLNGPKDIISQVRFSPDGRHIVTCNRDRTAKIWDAATGRLLRTLTGHREAVKVAAFSPDGRHLVTVGEDRVGILWEVATGQKLRTLKGHEDGIEWVCYSPDGKWIATTSRDRTAKIWSATEFKNSPILKAHQKGLNAAVFSHSGRRLITCGDDGTAKVWDAANKQTLFSLQGHRGPVNAAIYSNDDRRILTAGNDGTARVWDAGNGAPLLTLTESGSKMFSAAFSPDGRRIATPATDYSVNIRDAATGKVLFPLIGHTEKVYAIVFSPNGQLIATGGTDGTGRIWDAATGKLLHTLTGHTGRIFSVAFSSDGRQLVTGSRDRTARIWDVQSGKALLKIEGQEAWVYSVAFSPDGRRILTGGGLTAKLWDAVSGRQMLILNGHSKDVVSVAFSPDGHQILTASADQTARFWSAPPLPEAEK